MIETVTILGYIVGYGSIYVIGLVGTGMFLNWARKSTTNLPVDGMPKRIQRFLISMLWPISIPILTVWIVVYQTIAGIWDLYCYFE